MMLAAKGDHEDVMRTLIAAGADPSLRAQDGSTLLMVAAGGARLATFKYAYELDPHVDSVASSNGSTVMHAAANLGNRSQTEVCEVIQFLADHGAALDELDGLGYETFALDGSRIDRTRILQEPLIRITANRIAK